MSRHSFEFYEPVGYYQRGAIEDRTAVELGTHMYVSEPPPPPEKCTPREQKISRCTPGYPMWPVGELVYFPVRARAESLKMILHYAGLAYTLKTVEFSEWGELKPTVPNQCLPAFTPDEGEMFCETADIAKYIASISTKPGLLPADPTVAMKLMLMSQEKPFTSVNPMLNIKSKEDAKKEGPALAKECYAVLKKTAEPEMSKIAGPYFGGKAPHFGDFGVWVAVDQLVKLEPKTLDTLGASWKAWYDQIASLKPVIAYLACRPAAGSGKVGMPGSMMYELPLDGPKAELKDYDPTGGAAAGAVPVS